MNAKTFKVTVIHGEKEAMFECSSFGNVISFVHSYLHILPDGVREPKWTITVTDNKYMMICNHPLNVDFIVLWEEIGT